MPIYRVEVSYTVKAFTEIEAESADEAEDLVLNEEYDDLYGDEVTGDIEVLRVKKIRSSSGDIEDDDDEE